MTSGELTLSNQPVILSLETATRGGSVFLGRGTEELTSRLGDPEVSHSNSLLRDINDCLEEGGLSLRDLDLLACAVGPGSFTGLRIGIATMKALAATLSRPCAGIPTLHAVAHAAGPSQSTVALLPAGRGEVFAQMFSVSGDGLVEELDDAAHLSPENLAHKYEGHSELTWSGEGAHLQREFLESLAHRSGVELTNQSEGKAGWTLAPTVTNLARHVALLALQVSQNNQLQSAEELRAIYVRPSDAELKEQCR